MKIPNPLEYPLYSLGALIFALGVGYQLYKLVDGGLLSRLEGTGTVMSREYRPLSHGTFTTKVGSTVHTYPTTIPDAWLITVEVDGRRGTGEVPHGDYESFKEGESVKVAYSKRRIQGTLTIHAITKQGAP